MAVADKNYHNLLEKILQEGYTYEDPNRKGVNRLEIPSYTFRHEFKDGFPAISTKKLHYKNVATELIWFLRGDTNIKYLVDNGCNIWNKDALNYIGGKQAEEDLLKQCNKTFIEAVKNKISYNGKLCGDLGPIYGHQWRNFTTCEENIELFDNDYPPSYYKTGIDQIQRLIKNLKEKPLATDHIVNSWNVGDLNKMALPPCHYGFQIVVRPLNEQEQNDLIPLEIKNKGFYNFGEVLELLKIPQYGFELHWQQRSVDTFLGLPFNIASYATLALILEKITGYKALAIQGDLKKVHLYDNSLDAVKEQLSRDVNKYDKSEIIIERLFENDNFTVNEYINKLDITHFQRFNYESYPGIKVEMLERDE